MWLALAMLVLNRVVLPVGGVAADERAVQNPGGQGQADTSLTGVITVQWGDGAPGAGERPRQELTFTEDGGQRYKLAADENITKTLGGLAALDCKRATIDGSVDSTQSRGATVDQPILRASSIALQDRGARVATRVAGAQKFVTILCRFGDTTSVTPHPKSYLDTLMGNAYPGLDHYWRETSYGQINLVGSVVVGWYNLPQPRSYYIPGGNLSHQRAANDCTAAAESDVFFPDYVGINLIFNQDLDCCAWGGSAVLTRDGVTRVWSMTWMPPWGYENQYVLGHEMGHAFGLPHSSGPYSATYDSRWDIMSGGGACRTRDATYGCVGVNTISYHKDALNWFPSNRRYVAAPGSTQDISIERIGQVPVGSETYQMARIPIGGSTTRFYTVEARRFIGYDNEIPAEGVVIHRVDTTRSDRLAQIVDSDGNGNPNDSGATWAPGETFTDSANGMSVSVLAMASDRFTVRVSLGAAPPAPTNNNFASATTIASTPLTVTADTGGATTESNEPTGIDRVCAPIGATLWFKYVAPASASLTIATAGSGFDTVVAVYTGAALGSLARVACNDDVNFSAGDLSSRVTLSLTQDTTYWIQIGGYAGASGGLTAAFTSTQVPATLTVRKEGRAGGTVTSNPVGISCGADCSEQYAAGTSVSLTATPAANAVFTGWSGACFGRGSCTVTMNGNKTVTARFVKRTGPNRFDFDGDGVSDVAVWRPATGGWFVMGQSATQWGREDYLPVPGDYDGNGTDEVAVYHPASGIWFIKGLGTVQWGGPAYVPVPGDYDGDGKADIAVWKPSDGTWYIRGQSNVQWGREGYVPVPADYDGDGKTDIAVWQPSSGIWFIRGQGNLAWGRSGYVPVPGDFDGDGKADIAVWEQSSGTWFVRGQGAIQWGPGEGIPVPADYDGDDKTDFAVWEPATGIWYIRGLDPVRWGTSDYAPLARPTWYTTGSR